MLRTVQTVGSSELATGELGRRMHRDDGEWRLIEHPERLPLSYTLQAVKR